MFGEENLLFQCEARKDNKNRIILPTKTGVETGDHLVIYKDDYFISIYNILLYEKRIKDLKRIQVNAKKAGKHLLADELKHEIFYICSHIYDNIIVGKSNRIVIPKSCIEEYPLDDTVYLMGEYDHVNVFKNKETYKEYVKKRS